MCSGGEEEEEEEGGVGLAKSRECRYGASTGNGFDMAVCIYVCVFFQTPRKVAAAAGLPSAVLAPFLRTDGARYGADVDTLPREIQR